MKISNLLVQSLDSVLGTWLKNSHSASYPAGAGTAQRGGKRGRAQGGKYCSYPVYAKKTVW